MTSEARTHTWCAWAACECNNLCTVLWLKVFVLHSFSFAVMSCTVSRLLLLTKRFKAFLSLFVKLLFLPLRVKVVTVPVLRYLLRTLVSSLLPHFGLPLDFPHTNLDFLHTNLVPSSIYNEVDRFTNERLPYSIETIGLSWLAS